MSIPELVQSHLGDESVAARVPLGGEDELFVTPTRTLVYRADGLLSDESVEEYGHDAERLLVSDGRRKSKITFDYGLDGKQTLAIPSKRVKDALHPVLAGILNAAGITGPGETVKHTFQFSELTLVITSERVVKHIGGAVWDGDYEEFHYDDVTNLTYEDGSVATTIVLTTGNRQERFKTPNEDARAVREGLANALLAYYDVESLEEFRVTVAPEEEDQPIERDNVNFGDGPDPLSANPGELAETPKNATRRADEQAEQPQEADAAFDSPAALAESLEESAEPAEEDPLDAEESDGFEGSGFEAAVEHESRVADELEALTEAVEQQNRELQKQRETMTQLIEELRQGR